MLGIEPRHARSINARLAGSKQSNARETPHRRLASGPASRTIGAQLNPEP